MLVPRVYQDQTNKAIFKYMGSYNGAAEDGLVVWPVGTGKAFGIALFVRDMLKRHPSCKILVTCPSEELVEQNYKELKEFWPFAPTGVFCDGLKRYDTQHQVIFGTIQSIANSAHLFGKVDIMVPDECHRISKDEDTQYHKVQTYFRNKNKFFFILGWTATDYRMGQGKLTDEGGLFKNIIYDATTPEAYNWFFDQGFLIPPISAPTETMVSGEAKKMIAGDYNNKELQTQFEKDRECGKIEAALREAVAVATAEGRKCWIAFVPGVAACEETVELLQMLGVSATCVHSKLKKDDRRQRLADYKAGKYTCMVNNGILTTGFNHKPIDFMIMLRKTASASLWVQMLGRGTRPWYAEGYDIESLEGRWAAIRANGKLNFRVMDFVGNIDRLGPINDPKKPKAPGEKKDGGPPIKICPDDKGGCGSYNHPSVKQCFYCDFVFPVAEYVDAKASTSDIVRPPPKPPANEWLEVDHVTYKANYRTTKPTIVATYYCTNGKKFEQYICVEHDGAAGSHARRWWRQHSELPIPPSVMEAMPLTNTLKVPRKVLVWVERRQVKDYEFG